MQCFTSLFSTTCESHVADLTTCDFEKSTCDLHVLLLKSHVADLTTCDFALKSHVADLTTCDLILQRVNNMSNAGSGEALVLHPRRFL